MLLLIKGISHLSSARILGGKPYFTRRSLAHDFDLSDYTSDKVRNDINYLSYYSKNRDAVAADKTGKGTKSLFVVNLKEIGQKHSKFPLIVLQNVDSFHVQKQTHIFISFRLA